MANQTASAFGISGWDPVTSAASNFIDSAFGLWSAKRSAKLAQKQMAAQYAFAQKSLRESPSNYKIGLVNAGYNPLLALSDMQVPSSFSGSPVPLNYPANGEGGKFDAVGFASAKAALKTQKASIRAIEAEADRKEADAIKTKVDTVLGIAKPAASVAASAYGGWKLSKLVKHYAPIAKKALSELPMKLPVKSAVPASAGSALGAKALSGALMLAIPSHVDTKKYDRMRKEYEDEEARKRHEGYLRRLKSYER